MAPGQREDGERMTDSGSDRRREGKGEGSQKEEAEPEGESGRKEEGVGEGNGGQRRKLACEAQCASAGKRWETGRGGECEQCDGTHRAVEIRNHGTAPLTHYIGGAVT